MQTKFDLKIKIPSGNRETSQYPLEFKIYKGMIIVSLENEWRQKLLALQDNVYSARANDIIVDLHCQSYSVVAPLVPVKLAL